MQLLLSLILSLQALAADTATCKTTEIAPDGKTIVSETFIHYKEQYILRNGYRAPFLATHTGSLEDIPALAAKWRACNSLSDKATPGEIFSPRMKCTNQVMESELVPSNDPMGMAKLGIVFLLIRESSGEAPASMNLLAVASARSIELDKGNKFGTPGLYEYFNAEGNLIGRFLINTPLVLECN